MKRVYDLAKQLYITMTDDFGLARTTPALPYDPNHHDAIQLSTKEPAVYRRQGIFVGSLETIADGLVVREGEVVTLMSFGSFENHLRDENSPVRKLLRQAVDLFLGFHPLSRPVLWRILVAHALLHRELARGIPPLDEMRCKIRWSKSTSDNQLMDDTMNAAMEYLKRGRIAIS